MNPRLPAISGADVVKVLERAGFSYVGSKGSHAKLRHDDGRTTIVPLHRELARGTLRSILRQAGLSPDDLSRLL
ncbi:MAG: type II toxin-antitoxin system HicA family toxin [Actinomycetota bacterium]|nr:type II toxin-antitoxin system HicA family toxin [Actinomycetota bacterium]